MSEAFHNAVKDFALEYGDLSAYHERVAKHTFRWLKDGTPISEVFTNIELILLSLDAESNFPDMLEVGYLSDQRQAWLDFKEELVHQVYLDI